MADIVPVVILAFVLASILFRSFLPAKIAPWQSMAAGATAAMALGKISLQQAFFAIDWEVMAFLYGMFLLAYFLQKSWYLEHLGYKILHRFSSPFLIFIAIVFSIGASSAFLLNDTIAIIGVPLCLMISARSAISSKPLLVALALAVTIGSIASPIGNPQNFIIAKSPNLNSAFSDFAYYLGPPALLSLFLLSAIIWFSFPQLRRLRRMDADVHIRTNYYYAARRGFQAVLLLFSYRLLSSFFPEYLPSFPLWMISAIGAALAVLLSRDFKSVFRADFETLAFFAGMFVLMDAVWISGFFQQLIPLSCELSEPHAILASSLIFSQILSNVPFVILYMKALEGCLSAASLALLAAGSTLAGSLTLIGAASNIIVLQLAEKRGEPFPTKEFSIIGAISTLASITLILAWLMLIGALPA
ncbi:MAG: SLC13 family permease [Candidatus Micrarchaeota archaeon]|nr:SLC13 family permease [Candidatus Micrarchaeota archaeon]